MTIGIATINADNTVATFTAEQEVAEYPVTFVVKDEAGTGIESAKITVDGVSYLTDATGVAVVLLDAETYSNITVEKSGYTTQSNVSVTVTDKAVLKEVLLVEAV